MKTLTLHQMPELPYAVEEAMNRLRINFGFCGKEYKKVIVTSSIPDEGKSFVAVHLWRMLADAGNRVVLVDGDIRRSMLLNHYRITSEQENFVGLTNYLAGQAELSDVVYATNIKNADMVPVVNTVSNPSILLQNERFAKMLDSLAESYDYVIVDTPPMVAVSDGGLIASHCDGALLVVRSGVTPRKLISASMKELERANCRLMGTILSRVQQEQGVYYKKYHKYGKYGSYGYGQMSHFK